jgi:muramoyltetrapeptide carboxypeptidase
MPPKRFSGEPRVKPPALRRGDTIAVVAPASAIRRDQLEAGCEGLRQLGYKPIYEASILDHDLYFAGSAERRARELEQAFERDDVQAIICARGGYGCNYLLGHLDLLKIAAHPKIFVGYSDITSLLTWISDAANLVTFHGPMVIKDFAAEDGVDLTSWLAATGADGDWALTEQESGAVPLVTGAAEGILYGGCLSLLVASLGTPHEIRTEGTILLLEDVNAKAYQIDRMLMQLKLAGKLDGVRGIIFGEMLSCVQGGDQGYTLEEVVIRLLQDTGVPIAYGLRSGHVSRRNITLPIGVNVTLNVDDKVELRVLEASVSFTVNRAAHTRQ